MIKITILFRKLKTEKIKTKRYYTNKNQFKIRDKKLTLNKNKKQKNLNTIKLRQSSYIISQFFFLILFYS